MTIIVDTSLWIALLKDTSGRVSQVIEAEAGCFAHWNLLAGDQLERKD